MVPVVVPPSVVDSVDGVVAVTTSVVVVGSAQHHGNTVDHHQHPLLPGLAIQILFCRKVTMLVGDLPVVVSSVAVVVVGLLGVVVSVSVVVVVGMVGVSVVVVVGVVVL